VLAVAGTLAVLSFEPAWAQDVAGPPPAATRYARIAVDEQPVRCFANDNSPLYGDRLAKGDVVQIGQETNGFVPVTLPLGVTGYVHAKFATAPDEAGFVRTNGKRVSFRYRPRSTEAPADALDDDVALHFLAAEGDWYLVRNPRSTGYVPASSLDTTLDEAAAVAGWAALETTRRQEWQQRTAQRVEAKKREAVLQGQRTELQGLVDRFAAEAQKPWDQQQRAAYTALEAAAGKLAGAFETGSTEHVKVASLAQEIRSQILVLDAQAVAKENLPPPKQDKPVVPPPVADPLAAFDLVGFVRTAKSALPTRGVRLIRGGRVLGYLTCTNDRYDLGLFEGVEVGVSGPKEAAADGTWVLDVQRLDVLGVPIR